MSPEGIHNNSYGPKTDVWAFGIMLYELYHGQPPFCFCQSEQELKAVVLKPMQWNQLKASIPS
jgi:serine/threonine protein kinase